MSDNCDLVRPFYNVLKLQVSMDIAYIDFGTYKDFSFFVNGDADIASDVLNSICSILDSHDVSNTEFFDVNVRFVCF